MLKKINFPLSIIIFLALFLGTLFFYQKKYYHIDETFSFGQSNNITGPYMPAKDILYPSDFKNYLVVQKGHEFDYLNIVHNLTQGVHPPLFYVLLHTICSFFFEYNSKWLGYPINAFCLVLTLVILYKIALKLFEDRNLSYFSLILFAFSLTTLNMFVFIRSYMLQMLLATLLIYLHIHILQNKKLSLNLSLALIGLSVLSLLSHYYMLLFLFFLSSISCCILLIEKKIQLLVNYILIMFFSLFLAFCLFPSYINVILNSDRGEQFLEGVNKVSIFDIDFILIRFSNHIFTKILAFNSIPNMSFIVFLILFFVALYLKKIKLLHKAEWIMVMCTSVMYGLFVSAVYPDMHGYEDRYFAPISSSVSLLIVLFLKLVFDLFNVKKKHEYIFIFVLVLFNVFFTDFYNRSLFSYRETLNTKTIYDVLKNKKIIYFSTIPPIPFAHFMYLNKLFQNVSYVKVYDNNEVLYNADFKEDYFITNLFNASNLNTENLHFISYIREGSPAVPFLLYKIKYKEN